MAHRSLLAPEMLGERLGNYIVTGKLGEGGMGVVYAAKHALLGRPAALKVLLPELSRNPDVVERFFNEARGAASIRHPGIVEVYDFGYHGDNSAYIAMELLPGHPLSARIARGLAPVTDALHLVRQIAAALQAAHEAGIIHRDLKPDNVFVVSDPEVGLRVKLLDFGIAKLAGDGLASRKTQTGALIGTPTYMAPEQCRGVAVDLRADLYALGCILYELLTGRPPFDGEGAGDLLAAHIYLTPTPPSAHAAGVPPAIEAMVMRLLAKDPAARPASARELLADLDLALAGTQVGPRSWPGTQVVQAVSLPTQPTTLSGAAIATTANRSAVVEPERWRWRWAAMSSGALALVLGVGLAWRGAASSGVAPPSAGRPVTAPAVEGPKPAPVEPARPAPAEAPRPAPVEVEEPAEPEEPAAPVVATPPVVEPVKPAPRAASTRPATRAPSRERRKPATQPVRDPDSPDRSYNPFEDNK